MSQYDVYEAGIQTIRKYDLVSLHMCIRLISVCVFCLFIFSGLLSDGFVHSNPLWSQIRLDLCVTLIFHCVLLTFSLFSPSRAEPRLPQCHGTEAKTIKVYKYVNMVTAAQREERRNDIFCPRLANPQDTSKLETLMTTNNAQMVKLWGHTGPSDAARAPCGIALHANTMHVHTHTHTRTQAKGTRG